MRRLIGSALIASAIAVLPSIARANTFVAGATSCTGGSLNICLDFDLENTGGNNYSLELILNSVNGASPSGTGFSSFALFGGPVSGTFAGINAGPTGWSFTGCNDLSPLSSFYICDNNNGAKATDITFTFSYSGSQSDLSDASVAAHIQGIQPTGCSAKVSVEPEGETSTIYATDCDVSGPTPTTTTPEPASFVLIGTGLIGIGGVGATRRRRQK